MAMEREVDTEIEARMAHYRKTVGKLQGWPDAKTYEQVKAEIIKTAVAQLALAEQRGRLVDRKEVRDAARLMKDRIERHLQEVPRAVADKVPLTLEQKGQVSAACKSAIDAALDAALEEAKATK